MKRVSNLFYVQAAAYLLPLVYVADEPRESQQPKQTKDLCETYDTQGPRRLVHLRVYSLLHNEKDVIHWDGRDKVHHKPCLQVLFLDGLGIQDDVRVVFDDNTRAEVQHQVHEEESVRDYIEDDPRRGGLLLEERDAYWNDDQVAYHEEEHCKIPVEPGESGEQEANQNKTNDQCLYEKWKSDVVFTLQHDQTHNGEIFMCS